MTWECASSIASANRTAAPASAMPEAERTDTILTGDEPLGATSVQRDAGLPTYRRD